MLIEEGFTHERIGTLNFVGESRDDGVSLLVKDVEWGEYVDLGGRAHGPLSQRCMVALMQFACCEEHVLAMIRATGEVVEDVR